MKILQNWGNYADIFQATAGHTSFTIDVLLICWLGTKLTQHVSDICLFYSKYVTYIMQSRLNELGNHTHLDSQ